MRKNKYIYVSAMVWMWNIPQSPFVKGLFPSLGYGEVVGSLIDGD
jgi:hypothetical protein